MQGASFSIVSPSEFEWQIRNIWKFFSPPSWASMSDNRTLHNKEFKIKSSKIPLLSNHLKSGSCGDTLMMHMIQPCVETREHTQTDNNVSYLWSMYVGNVGNITWGWQVQRVQCQNQFLHVMLSMPHPAQCESHHHPDVPTTPYSV